MALQAMMPSRVQQLTRALGAARAETGPAQSIARPLGLPGALTPSGRSVACWWRFRGAKSQMFRVDAESKRAGEGLT